MEINAIIEQVDQIQRDLLARSNRQKGIELSSLSYDSESVKVGQKVFTTDRPRLLFARLLSRYFFDSSESSFVWPGRYRKDSEPYSNHLVDIGKFVSIGLNCSIGGPGFGYEQDENGSWFHIPHLGRVVIEDNVTIHNNTCIDRGVTGDTVIGEGTKIDNLVHVSHNVKIGKRCLIVAHSVIGGSCEIGDNTFIGMGALIKNKVKVGSNCVIGAGAVIINNVPNNQVWVGNPGRFLKENL